MKRFLQVVVLILGCVCLFAACSGKEENEVKPAATIEINTVDDLKSMNNYLGAEYSKYTFLLKADLDLSSIDKWDAVGNVDKPFCGTFDGNGKTLSGLTVRAAGAAGEHLTKVGGANGLFGYIRQANIHDVTLTNIDFEYYTEDSYNYIGGLVAFDTGFSKVENCSVNGKMKISNTYYMKITYDPSDGLPTDDGTPTCDQLQYFGGVIAYSVGGSVYKNNTSSIDIDNHNFYANSSNGYEISDLGLESYHPSQTFVGGVVGYVKNANIENLTANNCNTRIFSRSNYTGGVIGNAIACDVKTIAAKNSNVNIVASVKICAGGAIGIFDSGKLDGVSVIGSKNVSQKLSTIESISLGGGIGFVYDNATVKNLVVSDFHIESNSTEALIGGIVGAVRESELTDSSAKGKIYISKRINNDNDIIANFARCGAVVSSVYGNSLVKTCDSAVQMEFKRQSTVGITEVQNLTVGFAKLDTVNYVNDDGKPMVRLANKNNRNEYVGAFVTVATDNKSFSVTFYDEEGTEIESRTYAVDENKISVGSNDSEKYLAHFLSAGKGVIDPIGNTLALGSRDTANFVRLTGEPVTEAITVKPYSD